MYKVINIETGAVLAMTEAPNYINKADNGCFVLCRPEEAEGIAWEGVPYALFGKELEGAAGTVNLVETDTGEVIRGVQLATEDTDAMMVDQEYRLTMLELGLTEEGGN